MKKLTNYTQITHEIKNKKDFHWKSFKLMGPAGFEPATKGL